MNGGQLLGIFSGMVLVMISVALLLLTSLSDGRRWPGYILVWMCWAGALVIGLELVL